MSDTDKKRKKSGSIITSGAKSGETKKIGIPKKIQSHISSRNRRDQAKRDGK